MAKTPTSRNKKSRIDMSSEAGRLLLLDIVKYKQTGFNPFLKDRITSRSFWKHRPEFQRVPFGAFKAQASKLAEIAIAQMPRKDQAEAKKRANQVMAKPTKINKISKATKKANDDDLLSDTFKNLNIGGSKRNPQASQLRDTIVARFPNSKKLLVLFEPDGDVDDETSNRLQFSEDQRKIMRWSRLPKPWLNAAVLIGRRQSDNVTDGDCLLLNGSIKKRIEGAVEDESGNFWELREVINLPFPCHMKLFGKHGYEIDTYLLRKGTHSYSWGYFWLLSADSPYGEDATTMPTRITGEDDGDCLQSELEDSPLDLSDLSDNEDENGFDTGFKDDMEEVGKYPEENGERETTCHNDKNDRMEGIEHTGEEREQDKSNNNKVDKHTDRQNILEKMKDERQTFQKLWKEQRERESEQVAEQKQLLEKIQQERKQMEEMRQRDIEREQNELQKRKAELQRWKQQVEEEKAKRQQEETARQKEHEDVLWKLQEERQQLETLRRAEEARLRKAEEERLCKAEEEKLRKAEEERQRLEALRKAEEERQQLEALRKAEEERQRLEAFRKAEEEKREQQQLEALCKAKEERQKRIQTRIQREEEAQQEREYKLQQRDLEAAERRQKEKIRKEAEEKNRQEQEQKEAKERQQQEHIRMREEAQEKYRQEQERKRQAEEQIRIQKETEEKQQQEQIRMREEAKKKYQQEQECKQQAEEQIHIQKETEKRQQQELISIHNKVDEEKQNEIEKEQQLQQEQQQNSLRSETIGKKPSMRTRSMARKVPRIRIPRRDPSEKTKKQVTAKKKSNRIKISLRKSDST